MNSHQRIFTALSGGVPDHVPYIPKIWLDLNCIGPLDPLGCSLLDQVRHILGNQVALPGGVTTSYNGE